MTCEYCNTICQYAGVGANIELLVNLLIPQVSLTQRFTEINIVDWILHAKIIENEALVGEIIVNNWKHPESDFEIKNYFLGSELSYGTEDYIKRLVAEIKLFYEHPELQDGEHPILIKMIVTLARPL
jgi:hypothetical protein